MSFAGAALAETRWVRGARAGVTEKARLELRHEPGTGRRLASVSPATAHGPLSVDLIARCIDEASSAGAEEVITAALTREESRPFFDAGFVLRSTLHLLVHDLAATPLAETPRRAPGSVGPTLHRGRSRDLATAVAVDQAAFAVGWQLDERGVREALDATPISRFMVARVAGRVVGYAVTGRASRRGYLQRLAVDPAAQRDGIGRELVLDSLRWCRRRRVQRVAVNTQTGNEPALSLYRSLGFVDTATGLNVLEYVLRDTTRSPQAGLS